MIKKSGYIVCISCSLLLIQGCVPNLPDNQRYIDKKLSIPNKFPNYGSITNIGMLNKKLKGEKYKITAEQSWDDFFIDKKLKKIISIALKNNQELKILEQEIYIAQNDILEKKGEYYPKVGLGFQYEIEKVGKFTSQGINDETAEYESGKFVPKVLHNHQLGSYLSWEVDIWKKLRNATKSSYFHYLANIEVKKYLVTKLIAEITSTYYELRALDKQLNIVKEFILTLKRSQFMVKAQKNAAHSTSLGVKRFEAEVLKNKSRLYLLKQSILLNENKLNALLGRFPQKITIGTYNLNSSLPKMFNTGIPVKLLENRPDVKRANLELMASKIDIKIAKARFYPSLTIDAGAGYQAFNSKYFMSSPESIFYNLAGSLTAPIINRNAIKAAYYSANNKQLQAIYEYEKTFINAFKEVANQLASLVNLKKIYSLKLKQVRALSDSVDISNLLFKAARVEYTEALLTKRDLLESKMELVEINKQQLLSYVELYRALGGGWRGTKESHRKK